MSQLTEELKKKTKLIQSFLLREQHGRIKPPGKEQELHKKVNSIMDTIYAPNSTGKNQGNPGGPGQDWSGKKRYSVTVLVANEFK